MKCPSVVPPPPGSRPHKAHMSSTFFRGVDDVDGNSAAGADAEASLQFFAQHGFRLRFPASVPPRQDRDCAKGDLIK